MHRYPLLTVEEEIQCGRHIQAAQELVASGKKLTKSDKRTLKIGKRARDRLVTGNMRLVLSIAQRHMGLCKHLSFFDLCQEGCIGLVKAADKFDPSRGYKFSTYSFWWIRQSIKRSIDDRDRSIRIPGNMLALLKKVRKEYDECLQDGRKPASLEEMCDRLNAKQQHVRSALMVITDAASLDMVANNSDGKSRSTFLDLMVDENTNLWEDIHTELLKETLQAELDGLPETELALVSQHYGLDGEDPKTYQDIAKEMKVSRENVRQRVGRSHRKLRTRLAASRVLID